MRRDKAWTYLKGKHAKRQGLDLLKGETCGLSGLLCVNCVISHGHMDFSSLLPCSQPRQSSVHSGWSIYYASMKESWSPLCLVAAVVWH